MFFCPQRVDEVPLYYGQPGKSVCETNAKAVHAVAPPFEGKRLATLDLFVDAEGCLLLPVAIILIGSEVCVFCLTFFSHIIYLSFYSFLSLFLSETIREWKQGDEFRKKRRT